MKKKSCLGKQIKLIRGERSQAEFADIINVSQATLARYEKGATTPKLLPLRRIAAEGGVALDELMDGRGAHSPRAGADAKILLSKLNRKEKKALAAYRVIQRKDKRLARLLDNLLERLRRISEK